LGLICIASAGDELIDFVFKDPTRIYEYTKEPIRLAVIRMMCCDSKIWSRSNVADMDDVDPERFTPSALQYTQHMLGEKRWLNVLDAVKRSSRNRWNFITYQGYFGWAPQHAKEGDKIYLLFGAEVPILPRPEEDEFVLVGECYVHEWKRVGARQSGCGPDI
jgi:hypothetical protein